MENKGDHKMGIVQHLPCPWLSSTTVLIIDMITNRLALFEVEDKTAENVTWPVITG